MSALGSFARLVPTIGEEAASRCQQHWHLVMQWQATTNLTGVKTTERAIALHYEDALEALAHWLPGTHLCDVGSGAGFPGLVLAAARPHDEVSLLEPRRLRLQFLRAAVLAMGLKHVRVVAGSLANVPPLRAHCMTMRAVFSRDNQLDACAKHLLPEGRLLVFRQGDAHREATPTLLQCTRRHAYRLEGHAIVRSLDVWRTRGAPRAEA